MGYLIEIDPLRSLIVFPQPDEALPFRPNAGKKSKAPDEHTKRATAPVAAPLKPTPDCRQEEFNLPLE
jgi:hypothetical protein